MNAVEHTATVTRRGSGWGFRCSCGEAPNRSHRHRRVAEGWAKTHEAAGNALPTSDDPAAIAARISERAYMAYAYSEASYRAVARFLLRQGFSPAQTEWIMDSKHMRWAYDADNGRTATSGTFKRYYAKAEAQIRRDLGAEMYDRYSPAETRRRARRGYSILFDTTGKENPR